MWRWGEVKILSFCFAYYQGNEESGVFKISLCNLKGKKVLLNSSENTKELVGEERKSERRAVNVFEGCGTHCMKFVTLVRGLFRS